MDEQEFKWVPINGLKAEEGSDELVNAPDMQPYVRLAVSLLHGSDPAAALDEIARLPLEKRCVWRVASALKWAFADFDSQSVRADGRTLSEQDFSKTMELLRSRPVQFCLLLKALVGAEGMKKIMLNAISVAGRSEI